MRKLYCIIALFQLMISSAHSDNPLVGILDINTENEKYVVLHVFSYKYLNYYKDADLSKIHFDKNNHYGYLKCIDKISGKEVFNIPSPPLNYLWISPDSKYIVGLSKIKCMNESQLVIVNIKGELIYNKTVLGISIKFSIKEYNDFLKKYPKISKLDNSKVYKMGEYIYIIPSCKVISFDLPSLNDSLLISPAPLPDTSSILTVTSLLLCIRKSKSLNSLDMFFPFSGSSKDFNPSLIFSDNFFVASL